MKGHLDYMKQMETILVAVGVPTREAPGMPACLGPSSSSVTITEGAVDSPPDPDTRAPSGEPGSTTEENAGERRGRSMMAKGEEEMCDGWDIPDISDLLESLDDVDEERAGVEVTPMAPPSPDGPPDDEEEDDASWSWDDTQWTPKSKHVKLGSGTDRPVT